MLPSTNKDFFLKLTLCEMNGHFIEGYYVACIMKNPKACFCDIHDLFVVG